MKTKIFKHAALSAVILAGMGYGGMKAYDYSHARRVNSEDAMLIANVEALSDEEGTWGLGWSSSKLCGTAPDNTKYKVCEQFGLGGSCSNVGDLSCTCGDDCGTAD